MNNSENNSQQHKSARQEDERASGPTTTTADEEEEEESSSKKEDESSSRTFQQHATDVDIRAQMLIELQTSFASPSNVASRDHGRGHQQEDDDDIRDLVNKDANKERQKEEENKESETNKNNTQQSSAEKDKDETTMSNSCSKIQQQAPGTEVEGSPAPPATDSARVNNLVAEDEISPDEEESNGTERHAAVLVVSADETKEESGAAGSGRMRETSCSTVVPFQQKATETVANTAGTQQEEEEEDNENFGQSGDHDADGNSNANKKHKSLPRLQNFANGVSQVSRRVLVALPHPARTQNQNDKSSQNHNSNSGQQEVESGKDAAYEGAIVERTREPPLPGTPEDEEKKTDHEDDDVLVLDEQQEAKKTLPRLQGFASNVSRASRVLVLPHGGRQRQQSQEQEGDKENNIDDNEEEEGDDCGELNNHQSPRTTMMDNQRAYSRLSWAANRTAATAHAIAPQGILLRRVEKKAKKKEEVASGGTTGGTPRSGRRKTKLQQEQKVNSLEPNALPTKQRQEAQGGCYTTQQRPNLLTQDRLKDVTAPSWPWFQKYFGALSSMLQFEKWWSYPILIVFFLYPLTAVALVLSSTAMTTGVSVLNDYIQTVTSGQNAMELVYVYYDFMMEQWVEFKAGVGRRKLLLVAGLIVQMMTKHSS